MAQTVELEIGLARANITPPVGIRSAGFAARGPLTALHDPLLATAMVVTESAKKAALVTCDLLGLDAGTVAEIRSEVERRTGIPGSAVSVTCTHTHYGPDPYRNQSDPDIAAYRANLIFVIAGVVQEAMSRLQPAQLGVGWDESDIGINRREKLPDGQIVLGNNPLGPIDRAVGVLRIDARDGTPLACVVQFQTHPVSQGGTVSHISADYVGKMRDVIESLSGARCLFLQGACGNINPIIMQPTYESARTLGTRLGCRVVEVWETIHPGPAAGLNVVSTPVRLPRLRYGSLEEARELVRSLEGELEGLRTQEGVGGRIRWAETRLGRAREAVASWESGEPLPAVESELQAWSIGSLAMAMTPGEIFNQIGSEVKRRSPFEHTFFVGYANDSIGYVPVPEAYAEGGYEVTHASQVDPGAAGILTEECVRLLDTLGA